MLQSEKRSLIRFLLIYLGSTFLLFAFASAIFYLFSKHHLLDQQQEILKYEASKIKTQLRNLHQSNASVLYYPQIDGIDSAIYDLDRGYIFGTFDKAPALDRFKPRDRLVHIENLEPYYLGAAYLLITRPIDYTPITQLQKNILLFMLGGGLFFLILGYFLGKLFIAPMREAIERMNLFIQDTTHELNTPISTILTNIEMIEALDKCDKAKEELRRIEMASQTLSRIYDDLTYLNLNHQYHREITEVDMSRLVKERIAYFATMAEAKRLRTKEDIADGVLLNIDRNDALRLIDNLLSNAIKYNKPGGLLHVTLEHRKFVVEDGGVGIEAKELKSITQRFKRANKSEGGFGIGLDIVSQVVQSYGYRLSIESREDEGTKVTIEWEK